MNDLTSYNGRISYVMDRIGIDQIRDEFGMSQSQVYRYKKDADTLAFNRVYKLARLAGVSMAWIATGIGEIDSDTRFSMAIPFLDDEDSQPLYIDSQYFDVNTQVDNLRASITTDDAMGKLLPVGSTVVLDTQQKNGNGLFAIMLGRALTLREIQYQVDESLKITAASDDVDDIVVPKSSVALLDVVGKVVWTGTKING